MPTVTLYWGNDAWHDGPGWYYIDDEYPEDSCGAFRWWGQAADHAASSEYARPTPTAKMLAAAEPGYREEYPPKPETP
ncbi:MAG: hypothetical protein O7G84_13585 [Gammaproteobacteria bacterium]|nr:hypothetical protein [Gammaproteobacteria bacterium]